MKLKLVAVAALAACLLLSETASSIVVNSAAAHWTQERDRSESIVLREDQQTGATEMLVRYPAGHVFRPHWHTANEHIVLLEGRLSLQQGDRPEQFLDSGGYAFLAAREVQHTKCVSTTRCAFYVLWDSKLDFHPM